MNEREIAVLVEGSEARAYASLVGVPAPDVRQRHGLAVHASGAAVALVARSASASLNLNRIIGLGVVQPADEALIDDWSMHYTDQGLSFAVELGPYSEPQALSQWLRERRLRRTMVTSMHYRKVEPINMPPGAPRVIRAEAEQCVRVADICCEVFKMPEAAHAMISAAAGAPQWRHWLAIGDEGPMGAALSFVQDGVAWLGWDATLPTARGRGVQSALIAQRLADASESGCEHATSETAVSTQARPDASFRNYRRLGFKAAYERATWVHLQRAVQAQPPYAGRVAA